MKHKKVNRKNSNKGQYVNQVQISFTNKPITAWGGIGALIGKYLEQIKFQEWVEKALPVKEISPNGKGVYEKVLAQFLTSLTGGYHFSHMQWRGHGVEALEKSFDVKWLPRAASSLTRFWGKINTQGLAEKTGRGARNLARQLIERDGIKEDNLNLDSSVLTRYGIQDGVRKGYNPKKRGRPSHHPLIAFLGAGYTMNLWNRSGNVTSNHQAVNFYEQTIRSLPNDFRIKTTLADSGFYDIKFIEYLEGIKQRYIIAAPMAVILQKEIFKLTKWETVEKGIEVCDFYFQHRDEKWTKQRRYITVRQEIHQRPKAAGK